MYKHVFSHVSCVTLLGVPVEIYNYGSQLVVAYLTHFVVIVIIVKVYLPVFYNSQVMSANEVCISASLTLYSFLYESKVSYENNTRYNRVV